MKIFSITEAFSMQPLTLHVGGNHYSKVNKNKPQILDGVRVDRIELEKERVAAFENDEIDYYVGYDKDGNKLFKYLAHTVNVNYYGGK